MVVVVGFFFEHQNVCGQPERMGSGQWSARRQRVLRVCEKLSVLGAEWLVGLQHLVH